MDSAHIRELRRYLIENFREIRHIIKLRTGPTALPEMRAVVSRIEEIMKERAPRVFHSI